MNYSVGVPAHGTGYLRFTASEGSTLAEVKSAERPGRIRQ
jgi:hypothetical protein